jgi:hypothetical protein
VTLVFGFKQGAVYEFAYKTEAYRNCGRFRGASSDRESNQQSLEYEEAVPSTGLRIYLAVNGTNNFDKSRYVTPKLKFVTGRIFMKLDT